MRLVPKKRKKGNVCHIYVGSWRTQWLHLRGPITLNLSSRPLTTLRLMTAVVKIQTRWVVLGLRGKFWVMSRFWQQVPQLIGTDPNTVETSGLVTHLSTSAPLRRGNKSNSYCKLLFGSPCMNGLKITVDNIFLPLHSLHWISLHGFKDTQDYPPRVGVYLC